MVMIHDKNRFLCIELVIKKSFQKTEETGKSEESEATDAVREVWMSQLH